MAAAPLVSARPHNEDDFEFVLNESHERDDLSSLTSASGETDNESESDLYESQARSDVTLQMPSVDDAAAFMEEAALSMTQPNKTFVEGEFMSYSDSIDNTSGRDPEKKPNDSQESRKIELQIAIFGSHECRDMMLRKITDALPMWLRKNYEFLRTRSKSLQGVQDYLVVNEKGGPARIIPQPQVTLRVLSTVKAVRAARNPLFIVYTVGKSDNSGSAMLGDDKLEALLATCATPLLVLLEPGLEVDCDIAKRFTERFPEYPISDDPSHALDERFTFADESQEMRELFIPMQTFDDISPKLFTDLVLNRIEAADLATESCKAETCEQASGVPPSMGFFFPCCILLLLLSAWSIAGFGSPPQSSPMSGKISTNLAFHQITETNALIELPTRFRALPAAEMPEIIAAVTRGGKAINSRTQLIVDNLYSLDWSPTEAHGELMVAAAVISLSDDMADSYLVQYSTKTPFMQAIADKLRDLNNLGHLPDVDISRRVQELVKQVEDSRSYVVKASQHQLRSLKEHGAQGLKKIQEDYSSVRQSASEGLRRLCESAPAWKERLQKSANDQGFESMTRARKGAEKLRSFFSPTKGSTTGKDNLGKNSKKKRSRSQSMKR